jgi:AraC-like DNA-binding protein
MLAGVAGLSPFYFARAFKKSEGVTPHDYLIRCRVERTMELLAGTDLALSEIAIAAGFSDQSHCARRFREHVGVCPHDYRWSTR